MDHAIDQNDRMTGLLFPIFHCTKAVQIVFEMCSNEMKTGQNTRTEANGTERYISANVRMAGCSMRRHVMALLGPTGAIGADDLSSTVSSERDLVEEAQSAEAGNERQGFLEEPEFRAVSRHLPDDGLRDFCLFGYLTGMRKGEIASLRWQCLANDVLWLEAKHSKNRKPRPIPLVGELGEIIERRKAARQIERNGTVELSPLIFHRGGEPVREFRKSWRTACRAAGVEGRLFHDLRRSAVRNMVQAGVAQQVAMKVSGHRTASMFERYNIIVEPDVRQALAKTEQYRQTATEKVIAMEASR